MTIEEFKKHCAKEIIAEFKWADSAKIMKAKCKTFVTAGCLFYGKEHEAELTRSMANAYIEGCKNSVMI